MHQYKSIYTNAVPWSKQSQNVYVIFNYTIRIVLDTGRHLDAGRSHNAVVISLK